MSNERFLTQFDVSASALTSERLQMRLIANNMANMNTTRTDDGGPYQRMEAIVQSRRLNENSVDEGVSVAEIRRDDSPPRLVYNPHHPDANAEGYVAYPNIDIVMETTRLKQAQLAYQANATVIDNIKRTVNTALTLAD